MACTPLKVKSNPLQTLQTEEKAAQQETANETLLAESTSVWNKDKANNRDGCRAGLETDFECSQCSVRSHRQFANMQLIGDVY